MMANLLQQFYQLYQGQHKGLDLELEKLLATLSQTSDIDKELVNNFANIDKYQREIFAELAQHQQQLLNSIDELNHFTAVSTDERQHVIESARAISSNLAPLSIASLLNEMDEVIKLYHYVASELNNKIEQNHESNSQLIKQFAAQLTDLLDKVHINAVLGDQLDYIFNDLKETTTNSELYSNFHQVIKLLVKNINSEKEASKCFLDVLNRALLDVKNVVVDSSSLCENSSEQRKQWDQKLVQHLENIGDQLDENSTAQAKSSIYGEIDDILKAIKNKEISDKQEYQTLSNNFKRMEERLKTVEEQAQGYKSKLDQQKILSMQDSLTKLPNRAALDEKFADEFQRAQQLSTPLWVVVADLDFFKKINDNYGHTAGDRTLQAVASLISRSLRTSEFVARFGGEEFVILVPNINKTALEKMLNRVRQNVKSIPFKFKDSSISVTISLGATKVRLSDPSENFAFERADQALYQAKKQGRDRVIIQ